MVSDGFGIGDDGSPPREWGQPSECAGWTAPMRFTPTRVGTAYPYHPNCHRSTVHPHASGDSGVGT